MSVKFTDNLGQARGVVCLNQDTCPPQLAHGRGGGLLLCTLLVRLNNPNAACPARPPKSSPSVCVFVCCHNVIHYRALLAQGGRAENLQLLFHQNGHMWTQCKEQTYDKTLAIITRATQCQPMSHECQIHGQLRTGARRGLLKPGHMSPPTCARTRRRVVTLHTSCAPQQP